ncbi:MAG: serine/threonine-protein kinase [Polyangiaceae bacterium]
MLGLLGAGGMGNVYRARDLELGEEVALKMLRPEIVSNPTALDRFRLEVKLSRRVTHPHVARMFDIGEHGGERYLTMELIDGPPLSALLQRDGRLPVERAISIACGVCEGLSAAHAANVIHRDLKPDNVLLAKDGRTVVTDFGIAQAVGAEQTRFSSGFVGTPAYMSPEQVEGRAAGPAADLYALGAMLFEMVTGDVPWTGDSVFAVAAARLLHPPPDPGERRPDLPRELIAAIRTLLARAPEDRYPTAAAARDALRDIPIASRPGTLPPPRNLALSALAHCR